MNKLYYQEKFVTEKGDTFSELEITYNTWGNLNKNRDNVIWVCHALTANSNVAEWWPGMVGPGLMLDSSKYFIVCANVLGSCYGSTGPLSINPATGTPWFDEFPEVTTRDHIRAHEILRKHLGISSVYAVIGASIGGHQALEYSIMYPDTIKRLVLIASNAKQSPWAIAFNESQRLAIEADPTYFSRRFGGGEKGLKAARSIALLSYRNNISYNQSQSEDTEDKLDNYKASSYQAYQGDKLVKRFNPWSYYRLTQISDSYNVGRKRGGVRSALQTVKAKTLSLGIKTDLLFPVEEQKLVAKYIKNARFEEIDSFYGHDGFLIETDKISKIVKKFFEERVSKLNNYVLAEKR
ncbi:MAG: homoserine O-acetyltransferase [Bacteroidales bacterium]|nr:homoserine O-acetyltransferase [Bacteroidales bacterium]